MEKKRQNTQMSNNKTTVNKYDDIIIYTEDGLVDLIQYTATASVTIISNVDAEYECFELVVHINNIHITRMRYVAANVLLLSIMKFVVRPLCSLSTINMLLVLKITNKDILQILVVMSAF